MSEPLEGRLVPIEALVASLSHIGYNARGLGGQYRLYINSNPNPVLFLSISGSQLELIRNNHPNSNNAMIDIIEAAQKLGGTRQSTGTVWKEAFEGLLPGDIGYRGTH